MFIFEVKKKRKGRGITSAFFLFLHLFRHHIEVVVHVFRQHLRIALRLCDVRVTHHARDVLNLSTIRQHPGAKGMTAHVRVQAFNSDDHPNAFNSWLYF